MEPQGEARYITIAGQRVQVVDRQPPLPRRLDQLLSALVNVSYSENIRPSGPRLACTQLQEHPMGVLRTGSYLGPDRVLRDLRIEMCPFCGAACVRDISRDRMAGLPTGRQSLRRRDLILGWYSGSRPAGREYL
jgi:hypothetical protein